MKQNKSLKKWKKPELVVIIRCKSEENVLAGCKSGSRSCGNEYGQPTVAIVAS